MPSTYLFYFLLLECLKMPHSTLNTLCAWCSFYHASFEKTPSSKQLCILDSHQIVKQGHWIGFAILFSKSIESGELCFLLR